MSALSYRSINLITALGCGAALVFAVLYLQEHLELKPCYLCVTQRFFVTVTGLLFALAMMHDNFGLPRSIYASLSCLSAMGGAFFAMKQLWLQSLSEDQVPACGPPVEYVFEAFSASEIITILLSGDGNCSEVQWQLIGLSIPGWVLIGCVMLLAISLFQLLRKE
tara:strand:+ start:1013 stop:1507 length:495 start_codon:yes stop_codon:yes gene_type:complete